MYVTQMWRVAPPGDAHIQINVCATRFSKVGAAYCDWWYMAQARLAQASAS